MRPRERSSAVGRERWLISYADLITLLFAVFVVLYASSSVNQSKYDALSATLTQAFGASRIVGKPQHMTQSRSVVGVLDPSLDRLEDKLSAALAPFVKTGGVRVVRNGTNLSIEVSAGVLFASASADLSPEAYKTTAAIASVLAQDTHHIQVTGHTDDRPISVAPIYSNWELSALRASAVVRALSGAGVLSSRMTVVGESANVPLVSNDTDAGRARNRRVTINIMPAATPGPT